MVGVEAAVAVRAGAELEFQSLTLAPLRAGEVRVRMVATGICHADVIARDQVYPVPLPAVLGHEGAGVVDAVGEGVPDLRPGDHVVLGFNYCARCRHCLSGFPGNCEDTAAYNFGGFRPDGTSPLQGPEGRVAGWFFGQSSFATFSHVPTHIAVKVDSRLPLEALAPLGCGVMTGTGAVWNVLNPQPGTSLAVFGAGAVGMSALLAARLSGCFPLIAVDVVPERLALATRLGASHVIDASSGDVAAQVISITDGGVDHAVDAAGPTAVFGQLIDSLGTRGHGVLVGAPPPGDLLAVDLNASLGRGRRLSFVLEGDAQPQVHIPRLVSLIASGALDFSPLVKYFPFKEINAAIEAASSGTVVKPVVVFDAEGPPREYPKSR